MIWLPLKSWPSKVSMPEDGMDGHVIQHASESTAPTCFLIQVCELGSILLEKLIVVGDEGLRLRSSRVNPDLEICLMQTFPTACGSSADIF